MAVSSTKASTQQVKIYTQKKSGVTKEIMLDLHSSIGSGGEGDIYKDPTDSTLAIKIFKLPSAAKEAKLHAMIATPPQVLQATQTGGTVVRLSWPVGMVYDAQRKFIGYSMPYLDMSEMVQLREILNQKLREKKNLRGNSETDYKFRIVTAINLAQVLQYLHACGHAVIDLKPENILVNRTMGLVSFLDCDSFRIQAQGKIFSADACTPEYFAPECDDIKKADISTDLFALSVNLSQILNNDLHPSTGVVIQPTGAPDSLVGRLKQGIVTLSDACVMTPHVNSIEAFLPRNILSMLRKALLAPAAERPSALEWQETLTDLLDNRLKACPKNISSHTAFENGCPWCDQPFSGMQRIAPPIVNIATPLTHLGIIKTKIIPAISHLQKQTASSAAQAAMVYRQLRSKLPSMSAQTLKFRTKVPKMNFLSAIALPSWVTHYWLALIIASLGTIARYFLGVMGTDETAHQWRWIQSCINFPAAAAIGAWLVHLFTRKIPYKKSALLHILLRLGLLTLTYLIISILSVDFFFLSSGLYLDKPVSYLWNPYDILTLYLELFQKAKIEFIIYALCFALLYLGVRPPLFLNRDSLAGFTYALVCASFFCVAYMSVDKFISQSQKEAQIKKQLGELITIPAGRFVMGGSASGSG